MTVNFISLVELVPENPDRSLFQCNSSTQVGSQPITSLSWLPLLRLLVTLSKDGSIQVWKTRVMLNPNRPPMQANFFEPAGLYNFFFELPI